AELLKLATNARHDPQGPDLHRLRSLHEAWDKRAASKATARAAAHPPVPDNVETAPPTPEPAGTAGPNPAAENHVSPPAADPMSTFAAADLELLEQKAADTGETTLRQLNLEPVDLGEGNGDRPARRSEVPPIDAARGRKPYGLRTPLDAVRGPLRGPEGHPEPHRRSRPEPPPDPGGPELAPPDPRRAPTGGVADAVAADGATTLSLDLTPDSQRDSETRGRPLVPIRPLGCKAVPIVPIDDHVELSQLIDLLRQLRPRVGAGSVELAVEKGPNAESLSTRLATALQAMVAVADVHCAISSADLRVLRQAKAAAGGYGLRPELVWAPRRDPTVFAGTESTTLWWAKRAGVTALSLDHRDIELVKKAQQLGWEVRLRGDFFIDPPAHVLRYGYDGYSHVGTDWGEESSWDQRNRFVVGPQAWSAESDRLRLWLAGELPTLSPAEIESVLTTVEKAVAHPISSSHRGLAMLTADAVRGSDVRTAHIAIHYVESPLPPSVPDRFDPPSNVRYGDEPAAHADGQRVRWVEMDFPAEAAADLGQPAGPAGRTLWSRIVDAIVPSANAEAAMHADSPIRQAPRLVATAVRAGSLLEIGEKLLERPDVIELPVGSAHGSPGHPLRAMRRYQPDSAAVATVPEVLDMREALELDTAVRIVLASDPKWSAEKEHVLRRHLRQLPSEGIEIAASDPAVLTLAAATRPDIRRVGIVETAELSSVQALIDAGGDAVSLPAAAATPETVAHIHSRGAQVAAHGVDGTARLADLIAAGVDEIRTSTVAAVQSGLGVSHDVHQPQLLRELGVDEVHPLEVYALQLKQRARALMRSLGADPVPLDEAAVAVWAAKALLSNPRGTGMATMAALARRYVQANLDYAHHAARAAGLRDAGTGSNDGYQWDDFDAATYGASYLEGLRPDDAEALLIEGKFFHAHRITMAGRPFVVVGPGPVPKSAFPIAAGALDGGTLIAVEYARSNVEELLRQLRALPDWEPYWNAVSPNDLLGSFQDLSRVLAGGTVKQGSVFDPRVIAALAAQRPAGSSAHFVYGSLTQLLQEFRLAVVAHLALLMPGAPFSFIEMRESKAYPNALQLLPAVAVDETDVINILRGFARLVEVFGINPNPDRVHGGYTGFVLATGLADVPDAIPAAFPMGWSGYPNVFTPPTPSDARLAPMYDARHRQAQEQWDLNRIVQLTRAARRAGPDLGEALQSDNWVETAGGLIVPSDVDPWTALEKRLDIDETPPPLDRWSALESRMREHAPANVPAAKPGELLAAVTSMAADDAAQVAHFATLLDQYLAYLNSPPPEVDLDHRSYLYPNRDVNDAFAGAWAREDRDFLVDEMWRLANELTALGHPVVDRFATDVRALLETQAVDSVRFLNPQAKHIDAAVRDVAAALRNRGWRNAAQLRNLRSILPVHGPYALRLTVEGEPGSRRATIEGTDLSDIPPSRDRRWTLELFENQDGTTQVKPTAHQSATINTIGPRMRELAGPAAAQLAAEPPDLLAAITSLVNDEAAEVTRVAEIMDEYLEYLDPPLQAIELDPRAYLYPNRDLTDVAGHSRSHKRRDHLAHQLRHCGTRLTDIGNPVIDQFVADIRALVGAQPVESAVVLDDLSDCNGIAVGHVDTALSTCGWRNTTQLRDLPDILPVHGPYALRLTVHGNPGSRRATIVGTDLSEGPPEGGRRWVRELFESPDTTPDVKSAPIMSDAVRTIGLRMRELAGPATSLLAAEPQDLVTAIASLTGAEAARVTYCAELLDEYLEYVERPLPAMVLNPDTYLGPHPDVRKIRADWPARRHRNHLAKQLWRVSRSLAAIQNPAVNEFIADVRAFLGVQPEESRIVHSDVEVDPRRVAVDHISNALRNRGWRNAAHIQGLADRLPVRGPYVLHLTFGVEHGTRVATIVGTDLSDGPPDSGRRWTLQLVEDPDRQKFVATTIHTLASRMRTLAGPAARLLAADPPDVPAAIASLSGRDAAEATRFAELVHEYLGYLDPPLAEMDLDPQAYLDSSRHDQAFAESAARARRDDVIAELWHLGNELTDLRNSAIDEFVTDVRALLGAQPVESREFPDAYANYRTVAVRDVADALMHRDWHNAEQIHNLSALLPVHSRFVLRLTVEGEPGNRRARIVGADLSDDPPAASRHWTVDLFENPDGAPNVERAADGSITVRMRLTAEQTADPLRGGWFRDALTDVMRNSQCPANLIDRTALACTELAGNIFLHTTGAAEFYAELSGLPLERTVSVDVYDTRPETVDLDAEATDLNAPLPEAGHGRGMSLLRTFTNRAEVHDVTDRPPFRKRVHVELTDTTARHRYYRSLYYRSLGHDRSVNPRFGTHYGSDLPTPSPPPLNNEPGSLAGLWVESVHQVTRKMPQGMVVTSIADPRVAQEGAVERPEQITTMIRTMAELDALVMGPHVALAAADLEHILDNGGHLVAVFNTDGIMIGEAQLLLRRMANSADQVVRKLPDRAGFLDGNGVRPDHQGKGIGTVLVRHRETIARSHGAEDIFATVRVENAESLFVLQRTGFAIIGYNESYFDSDGLAGARVIVRHDLASDPSSLDALRERAFRECVAFDTWQETGGFLAVPVQRGDQPDPAAHGMIKEALARGLIGIGTQIGTTDMRLVFAPVDMLSEPQMRNRIIQRQAHFSNEPGLLIATMAEAFGLHLNPDSPADLRAAKAVAQLVHERFPELQYTPFDVRTPIAASHIEILALGETTSSQDDIGALLEFIRGVAYGPPPATVRDLAQEVGVSEVTVWQALTDREGPSAATRDRVLAAAVRLGYQSTRVSQSQVAKTAGVSTATASWVFTGAQRVSDSFAERVIEAALQLGYPLPAHWIGVAAELRAAVGHPVHELSIREQSGNRAMRCIRLLGAADRRFAEVMVAGKSDAQIASELNLSAETVQARSLRIALRVRDWVNGGDIGNRNHAETAVQAAFRDDTERWWICFDTLTDHEQQTLTSTMLEGVPPAEESAKQRYIAVVRRMRGLLSGNVDVPQPRNPRRSKSRDLAAMEAWIRDAAADLGYIPPKPDQAVQRTARDVALMAGVSESFVNAVLNDTVTERRSDDRRMVLAELHRQGVSNGRKAPTISDVARELGISRNVVERILKASATQPVSSTASRQTQPEPARSPEGVVLAERVGDDPEAALTPEELAVRGLATDAGVRPLANVRTLLVEALRQAGLANPTVTLGPTGGLALSHGYVGGYTYWDGYHASVVAGHQYRSVAIDARADQPDEAARHAVNKAIYAATQHWPTRERVTIVHSPGGEFTAEVIDDEQGSPRIHVLHGVCTISDARVVAVAAWPAADSRAEHAHASGNARPDVVGLPRNADDCVARAAQTMAALGLKDGRQPSTGERDASALESAIRARLTDLNLPPGGHAMSDVAGQAAHAIRPSDEAGGPDTAVLVVDDGATVHAVVLADAGGAGVVAVFDSLLHGPHSVAEWIGKQPFGRVEHAYVAYFRFGDNGLEATAEPDALFSGPAQGREITGAPDESQDHAARLEFPTAMLDSRLRTFLAGHAPHRVQVGIVVVDSSDAVRVEINGINMTVHEMLLSNTNIRWFGNDPGFPLLILRTRTADGINPDLAQHVADTVGMDVVAPVAGSEWRMVHPKHTRSRETGDTVTVKEDGETLLLNRVDGGHDIIRAEDHLGPLLGVGNSKIAFRLHDKVLVICRATEQNRDRAEFRGMDHNVRRQREAVRELSDRGLRYVAPIHGVVTVFGREALVMDHYPGHDHALKHRQNILKEPDPFYAPLLRENTVWAVSLLNENSLTSLREIKAFFQEQRLNVSDAQFLIAGDGSFYLHDFGTPREASERPLFDRTTNQLIELIEATLESRRTAGEPADSVIVDSARTRVHTEVSGAAAGLRYSANSSSGEPADSPQGELTPTATDPSGYVTTSRELALANVTVSAYADMTDGRAPLGFDPESWRLCVDELRQALLADGISDADVRLKGTSAYFYSGDATKVFPQSTAEVESMARTASDATRVDANVLVERAVQNYREAGYGNDAAKPSRAFFDSANRLGISIERSDYDFQLCSDILGRRFDDLARSEGIDVYTKGDWYSPYLLGRVAPELQQWVARWEEIQNRWISVATYHLRYLDAKAGQHDWRVLETATSQVKDAGRALIDRGWRNADQVDRLAATLPARGGDTA
ncbi:MAG: GNAT family N-acetyltransferase, partial [Mycobacteriaceae bacterium]|nr:GNAT family N-acetyltransferase [Mycobacteriaceae bacterium]